VVTAYLDAWNAHDLDRIAALVAPDYEGTDVADAAVVRGAAALRRRADAYLTAFPDLRLETLDAVADGDRTVVRWSARATHRGAFLHIPPTGRPVVVEGTTWFTLAGGRVHRTESVWDVAGFLRAVGLLPALPGDALA
jgi:steroid delta-isomerase-like uncharacterized protein